MESPLPGAVLRHHDLPGLRMHAAHAGPEDGEPVILLHGFPEFWYSWRFQITALAEAGYRVIAPDQRGYNLTEKKGPYKVENLVRDIANLQDALGIARSHIVGHDWGGVVAWAFAGFEPGRTATLVSMNAPHPGAYTLTCRKHFKQVKMSWYIFFFQLPWLPERMISKDNFKNLDAMFRGIPKDLMTRDDIALYKEALGQPGALTAAINWYRAMGRRLLRSFGRPPRVNIKAPTLVIWGERDIALCKENNDPLPKFVPDLRVEYLPKATHWVQMDHPDEVNRLMLGFLQEHRQQPEGSQDA